MPSSFTTGHRSRTHGLQRQAGAKSVMTSVQRTELHRLLRGKGGVKIETNKNNGRGRGCGKNHVVVVLLLLLSFFRGPVFVVLVSYWGVLSLPTLFFVCLC